MERDIEIAQLKHDLETLRTRYAGYQRQARLLKSFCIAAGLILALLALALAVKLFTVDVLFGLYYLAVLLIFVPALVWMIRLTGLRWIDLATQRLRSIYRPDFFTPGNPPWPSRSDADATEQQIAAYEQRLSELGEG